MLAGLADNYPAVAPMAILVLALALRLPLIAGGQIDYDEGVYWQSLRSLAGTYVVEQTGTVEQRYTRDEFAERYRQAYGESPW